MTEVVFVDDHECEFCGKEFSSKASVKHHQKTAKYCLKKQGKQEDRFKCDTCGKKFSTKRWLINHYQTCIKHVVEEGKKDLTQEINRLRETIGEIRNQLEQERTEKKKLQDQLVEIASKSVSRPVTVNQNNSKVQQINNLYAITPTHFEEQSENLTLEHIKEGVAGYVRFALEFMLKNRILCTDVSRKIVKYKNSDDVVVTDAEMTILAEKIFSAIKVRNENIIDTYLRELNEKLWDANHDGLTEKQIEELERGLDVVRNMVMRLVSQRRESKEITMGKKPQLHRNFVKGICERSTQIDT